MKKGIFILLSSVLFGCGGGSDDGINTEVNSSSSAQTLTSDAVVINEDEYYGVRFSLSDTDEIKIITKIIDGPAIEAFLVTEAEYNTWVTITQNGQFTSADLNYNKDLSLSPIATQHESLWWRLGGGVYYYILENTDYGSTIPPLNFVNDKVTVDYSISVR